MQERKDSDFVMPGEEMQQKLRALDCHASASQVDLVANLARVSDAAVRHAAAGKRLYRREWNLLADELGISR